MPQPNPAPTAQEYQVELRTLASRILSGKMSYTPLGQDLSAMNTAVLLSLDLAEMLYKASRTRTVPS